MFKNKQGDLKKYVKKLADTNKNTFERYKYLKNIIAVTVQGADGEDFNVELLQPIYDENFHQIYMVFHDVYMHVENERRTKGPKSSKEEFDILLQIFEKTLRLLPHLLKKRWQFHSIRRIFKTMLHIGNSHKIRLRAVKLFIVWYQILQENNDIENHQIFSKLAGLTAEDEAFFTFSERNYMPTASEPVCPTEIVPITAPSTEDKSHPHNHVEFLKYMLVFIVAEVRNIYWDDEHRETAFKFLFECFKTYYLHAIFPNFNTQTSVYTGAVDQLPEYGIDTSSRAAALEECQDLLIRWFANFVLNSKKKEAETSSNQEERVSSNDNDYEHIDMEHGNASTLDSKTGTLTNGSLENSNSGDNLRVDSKTVQNSEDHAFVTKILLGDRVNVDVVHEVFRQAFLLPLAHAGAIRRVVLVYKDWLQLPEARPNFMMEPYKISGMEEYDDTLQMTPKDLSHPEGTRSHSAEHKVQRGRSTDGSTTRAGLQNSLLLFIKHSAYVFMVNPDPESLTMQVDLCRRVLNIYRHMVMNIKMNTKTWEQLLVVLLKVTKYVLGQDDGLLGKHLAASLIQTLIVSWIKANLCIHMSESHWDQMLSVLSTLHHWPELIREWAKTMETLTRVLANQVYHLDLNNLPLEKKNEQKKKIRAFKPTPLTRSSSKNGRGTFSRAYTKFNGNPIVRMRSSTNMDEELAAVSDGECNYNSDDGVPTAGRGRSFTDSQSLTPGESTRTLTRSNSDGKLSASTERLKASDSNDNIVNKNKLDNRDADIRKSQSNTKVELRSGKLIPNADLDVVSEKLTRPIFTIDGKKHIPTNNGTHSSMENLIAHSTVDVKSSHSYTSAPGSKLNESPEISRDRTENGRQGSDTNSYVSASEPVDAADSDDTTSMISYGRSECGQFTEETQSLSSTAPYPEWKSDPRSRSNSPTISNELAAYLSPEMTNFLHKDSDSHVLSTEQTDGHDHHKTDNMQIDEVVSAIPTDLVTDYRSVLSGGQLQGWTPQVAVVLWKRILGSLGDLNQISNPTVHLAVFNHLLELQQTLIRLSDNMDVSESATVTLPPGDLNAPLLYLFPICIKCLELNDSYHQSKLVSIQILCKSCLRFDYQKLTNIEMSYFYQMLNQLLTSTHQEQLDESNQSEDYEPIVNTLVRHSSPLLFGLDLPGSTLFIIKAIKACATVLSSNSIKNIPRREAIALLGTLVCFPNHYDSIPVIMQDKTVEQMESSVLKDVALPILLEAGRKEPAGLARCVALSSLAIFICEEIIHKQEHPRFKEAVNVLLVSLRFNTKMVGSVACDMLYLLGEFVPELEERQEGLSLKIISTIVTTLHNHIKKGTSEDNLLISIMFCLLNWCLNLPINCLLKREDKSDCMLNQVIRVLMLVVNGPGMDRNSSVLSQEYDLESLLSVAQCTNSPMRSLHRSDAFEQDDNDNQLVTSAASFILRHLINHVGQYPATDNICTRTYTSVNEWSDTEYSDLSRELFNSAHLQMFVCNKTTLISVLELDKSKDLICKIPGCDIPSTTARIIVRDITGKYSWSGTLVYENKLPNTTLCRSLSITSLQEENMEALTNGHIDGIDDQPDALVQLLDHITESSPECQLQPGEPLAEPGPTLESNRVDEDKVINFINDSLQEETTAVIDSKSDMRLKSLLERSPPSVREQNIPSSPFTVCRQLLQQLGYLNWDSRQTYTLLEKNDKLLREIKNLDSHRCRETHKIAVIYVSEGQEDKESIICNVNGSAKFDKFVSALGWDVELATHEGFMGGLQSNGTNGLNAPYYTNSVTEVMFHVTTRMPSETNDDQLRKLRHIGNDEVFIVWSEHYRPFRRTNIPTEFGDVIIIIYPLQSGLYRIQIDKKPEVALYFGPLFDGAIVSEPVLATLVRSTAINASRTHRLNLPHYQPFYNVRMNNISNISDNCRLNTTFETYAASILSPHLADHKFVSKSEFDGQEVESDVEQTDGVVKKEERDDQFKTRMIRRLSMRNRKSGSKTLTMSTPPDSPNKPKT